QGPTGPTGANRGPVALSLVPPVATPPKGRTPLITHTETNMNHGMASADSVLSEEQLLCPICLDLLNLPVSTPCGHNFCRDCIQGYWQSANLSQCPVCKQKFYRRPELKVNTFISEVASQFKKSLEQRERNNAGAGDRYSGHNGGVSCDVCVGKRVKLSAENAENELEESLKVFIKLLHLVQKVAVDVTLDPDTAHPKLLLTENRKQVHHGDVALNLPDNPKRFYPGVSVLGREGFSSGRFYYEVQVKGKKEWDVGVALESVSRKGGNTLNPESGFWAVGMRQDESYWALGGTPVHLPLVEKPHRVGVYVDLEAGQVSFYNVGSASHIYSFTGYSFSERLLPYFNPRRNHGGVNSAPLIILPVNV
uniref:G protein-coupled receptor 156 n=1 Tax=Labrus bergylta TaxID=56723 RepID=A0A3Q3G6V7_9LABR